MDHRVWAAAVVAALAAGCFSASAQNTVSFQGGRGAADAAANDWDEEATLAGALGVEGVFTSAWMLGFFWKETTTSGSSSSSSCTQTSSGYSCRYSSESYSSTSYEWSSHASFHWSSTGADPRLGDGFAVRWAYLYVADGNVNATVIFVDGHGKVSTKLIIKRPLFGRPIGEVKIDSDDAFRRALAASATLRDGLGRDFHGTVEALHHPANTVHARWLVVGGGMDLNGMAGAAVEIDAVTGDVLRTHDGFADMPRSIWTT